ncbi:cysteine--tRNA ligase [Propionigenium maris DSM 9537]|uniref:Cysteine--tRNA ligase n=2 Tax=Propionigenium TaxID=2332 RepID=A0A9W6LP66_9FUSO|nr:cysteine--tRNA ligase [Propionigenium maris DSM 9537]
MMIRLHNTLTGKIEEFKPMKEGEVSMYVCGPTVYNYIHIGNARPAIFFDTVRRYLDYRGYKVKYVQNFTDVDDKMIMKANEEGVSLKEIGEKYIAAYFEDTAKVNLKEEGMIRPRATQYIGEMIKIIKDLENKGFAYESQGDVYFNVEAYKEKYGELSGKNIDDLKSGASGRTGAEASVKRSSVDFALWKSAKEGEPAWGSPWGQGRPGWHIECSAMSNKLLGPTFDIHGGGQDLIFPHHENEIAQSKCSTGGEFARYWIHNGYINVKGEKMSKSLGNFFLLREVLEKYDGRVVRFFVLSSHYRKPIDFSEDEMKQAKAAVERIENSIIRANERLEDAANTEDNRMAEELSKVLTDSKAKFIAGMDEDFNTALGMGAIFELVKELNRFLDTNEVSEAGKKAMSESVEFIGEAMTEVLGVELKTEKQVGNMTAELVEYILELRTEAKKEKNYAKADAIRDRLAEMGISIKDGRDKTTWSI